MCVDDEEEQGRGSPPTRHRSQSPSSTTDDASAAHCNASQIKPRIWSLADLAASPTQSPESSLSIAGKMGFHRPLHLDSSPYGRPLNASRLTPPQEALLQVYAKTLGLSAPYGSQPPQPPFPPHGFSVLPSPLHPLPPTLSPPTSLSQQITRPLATRSLLPMVTPSVSSHLLPGGARIGPSTSTPST